MCVFNGSRSSAHACVCDSGRCIHYISSHRSITLVLSQCWWDPIAFGTICHSNNCPFIKSEAEIGLTEASLFPLLSLSIYRGRVSHYWWTHRTKICEGHAETLRGWSKTGEELTRTHSHLFRPCAEASLRKYQIPV